jgi:hypothetical protein
LVTTSLVLRALAAVLIANLDENNAIEELPEQPA